MGKTHAASYAAIMLENSNIRDEAAQLKAQLSAPAVDLWGNENRWTVWWNQDKLCYKKSFGNELDANNFIQG